MLVTRDLYKTKKHNLKLKTCEERKITLYVKRKQAKSRIDSFPVIIVVMSI
jgi:hypothetical protein